MKNYYLMKKIFNQRTLTKESLITKRDIKTKIIFLSIFLIKNLSMKN